MNTKQHKTTNSSKQTVATNNLHVLITRQPCAKELNHQAECQKNKQTN